MKRVTRRTTKQGNENDPFTSIPVELVVEILMKLPPRSIARLRFASKYLSSIITGKEFTDLYMARSSTQPRYLFSVSRHGYKKMHLFHSCSQEDPSASDHHDTVAPGQWYIFTPPIRGLICGRKDNEIMIGNPSTGQFVFLPRVKTKRNNILSVLGYDPVNDLYKVLCMSVILNHVTLEDDLAWSNEHRVITVGAKEKWRMVECKYSHRPYGQSDTQGICRDGVVYYLASYKQKRTLMSFHLSSEELNVTKLPEDYMPQHFGYLVNHTGKVTISTHKMYYDGPINLWVLEDAKKGVWSKAAAVVPSVADICGSDHPFMLSGILRTGEIIFAPYPTPNPYFVICYDPKEKNGRKVVIEGIGDGSSSIHVFFDHVESYMFP